MELHDIEITMVSDHGAAPRTSIKVDGVDLALKSTEVVFTHKGGQIPTVTITLVPEEVHIRTVGSVATKRLL